MHQFSGIDVQELTMLLSSFCFLPGIGEKKEVALWEQGILTWDRFLQAERVRGIAPATKQHYDEILLCLRRELAENNSNAFADWGSESWRLYNAFKDHVLFLDIETDQDEPTVIGMYDKERTMVMVRGMNMEKALFEQTLKEKKLLVTYNGRSFDVPRLERYFKTIISLPHIDLRGLCQRMGLQGGLKDIEQQLGIPRPPHLHGHPIELWRSFFASGDREYLDLLIQYNEEDTVNLHPLMEIVYSRLVQNWRDAYGH
ncbi:ribonuclease H-like domain-containing protein [Candidatus Woesearchaeota archaeon]|nr:ribonuclease H-like domain-containing protein [Candidatus Woesearchaeota archaeon]